MSFDFAAAQKEALGELNNNTLGLIVLGQSGGGKSYLAGTFGVKTLYLYTSGESHGAKAARYEGGKNVIPVQIDYANGKRLTPDQAYKRLLEVLSDVDGIKKQGFGAVVLDGTTEVEILIRSLNQWRIMCQTKDGKHNSFAEGPTTLALFRPVIEGLKGLQRQGIHFMTTCILDVSATSDDGEILESKPRLQTYAVAEGIIQQFEDIVAVGRMAKGDNVAHRIQFLAGVSRQSKDLAGNVKKSINFNPRIGGKKLDDLPRTLAADLTKLIEFKGA